MSPSDNVPYTANEQRIGALLMPGVAKAITIRELKALTNLDERTIKHAVQGLRVRHNIPVGSRRQRPCGYFILETGEEVEDSFRTLMNQALSMMRSARSLPGIKKQRIKEYLGQVAMELEL